jgi:hypothetical protein
MTFCQHDAHRIARWMNENDYAEAVVFPHRSRKFMPFETAKVPTDEQWVSA